MPSVKAPPNPKMLGPVAFKCGSVMVVPDVDELVKLPLTELNPSWSALVEYHWYSPEVRLRTSGMVSQ